MTRINRISLIALAALICIFAVLAAAEESADKPLTLATLTAQIDTLARQEVVLTGTVIGVCKSGCKMWIADGNYKKGDPYALVRTRDDSFKFEKDATGKTVILRGYGVAKYLDYCAESGEKQEGAMKQCETPVTTAADQQAKKKAEKKEITLKDITFFATSVEYK